MTKPQQKRALELLRQCMASGTIAKGYADREPRRCLGDEIEEFLCQVEHSATSKNKTQQAP